jgi:CheY-like chemotaxis protein/HPt (histidine-containing phosphotransfer) domain-containing protein
MINEVAHLNVIRHENKPLEFKINVGENVPAALVGDDIRIKQVLNNLLSNAFKFTNKGEVSLTVGTEPGEGEGGVVLVITVSDTGCGISERDLKFLFNGNALLNTAANRTTSGTNVGINIIKQLLSLMGGSIETASELGKGSSFTVRLPQKLDGTGRAIDEKTLEDLCAFKFSNVSQIKNTAVLRDFMPYGKVLIVDDTETNLFVAELMMKPYGLEISTAPSGFEAVNLIKAGKVYDIIFMDYMMPKMDGAEALNLIRALGYKNPIIALTADAAAGQSEFFIQTGFDDFMPKPIDIRLLNAVLNKYVRDRQTEGAINSMDTHTEEQSLKTQPFKKNGGLPEIKGLDYKRGLDTFGGEEDDYISALRSFSETAPDVIGKLRGAAKDGLDDYAVHVHGLKSMSGWIGAEEIRALSEKLEFHAKAGEADAVVGKNPQLLAMTEELTKNLIECLR